MARLHLITTLDPWTTGQCSSLVKCSRIYYIENVIEYTPAIAFIIVGRVRIFFKRMERKQTLGRQLLGFPSGSEGKNQPAMQESQETQVQALGWEDSLEENMATHFSILAWRILWTEEPGGL